MNERVEIVTVYRSKQAITYLLSEYMKDPERARILKIETYRQPPIFVLKARRPQ